MHTWFWCGHLKKTDHLQKPWCKWEDTTKTDFKATAGKEWTGLIEFKSRDH